MRARGCTGLHYRDNHQCSVRPSAILSEVSPARGRVPAGSNCSVQSGTQTQTAAPHQPAEWGQGLQQNSPQFVSIVFNEDGSFQNESKDVRVPESFEQSQN